MMVVALSTDIKNWVVGVLITALLAFGCYWAGEYFTYSSFWFAWTLNLLGTLWFSLTASLFKPELNSSYFQAKPFEQGGTIYRYAGVYYFRKLLEWRTWDKLGKVKSPINKNIATLQKAEYDTKIAELNHTVLAVLVLILTMLLTTTLKEARCLLITNLFLHIYPILVQRYNRPRYQRVICQLKNKV
ncbi:hypothetical protein [Nibribacter koreensis]|uniref:Glycosyl-4,4'-diaponeurosporenoate acyltransferase n=1 Tax=Nibribacter koreensis TaxID=1084519 RepID=A0ABP8FS76_9BACT